MVAVAERARVRVNRARTYTADQVLVLVAGDTLTQGNLLPGFSLDVGAILAIAADSHLPKAA
jgi:hypothetical protein